MNKKIIFNILGIVVIVGVAFYGGTVYGKKNNNLSSSPVGAGQLSGFNGVGARGMNNGFTSGEIISKDESSITIKSQDGSTKIALVGLKTQIMKSTTGSLDDLVTGASVTVTGVSNSDGSVTAESVQIRPAGSAPFNLQRRNNE